MEYYSWKEIEREEKKTNFKDGVKKVGNFVYDHRKEIIILTVALAPLANSVIRAGINYNTNTMTDRRTWDPVNGIYFHHKKMSNSQKINYTHFRNEGYSVLEALKAAGVKIK